MTAGVNEGLCLHLGPGPYDILTAFGQARWLREGERGSGESSGLRR